MTLASSIYTVHRASLHQREAQVSLNGETVTAVVPTLEVELIPVDGQAVEHAGTVKLAYQGGAIDEAKTVFVEGQKVSATFAPVAPAA